MLLTLAIIYNNYHYYNKGFTMSKDELNKIIADARKTPSTDEIVAKLVGAKKQKKPSNTRSSRSKAKANFLKQIEAYNDYLVQNDLEAEPIDVANDYDFSAFKSLKDYRAESERLTNRLNDRQEELKQNVDAGEFTGKELEGGMPSFEEVQNMSEDEFKAYEAKYLTPNVNEFKEPVVEAPVAVETVTPKGYGVIQNAKTGEVLAEVNNSVDNEVPLVQEEAITEVPVAVVLSYSILVIPPFHSLSLAKFSFLI